MSEQRLIVNAGPHDRRRCPISYEIEDDVATGTLKRLDTGQTLNCQIVDGRLHFVLEAREQLRDALFEDGIRRTSGEYRPR